MSRTLFVALTKARTIARNPVIRLWGEGVRVCSPGFHPNVKNPTGCRVPRPNMNNHGDN